MTENEYDPADDVIRFVMCVLCGEIAVPDAADGVDDLPVLYRGQFLHGTCAAERFGPWAVPDADSMIKPGTKVTMSFWNGEGRTAEGTVEGLCDMDGHLSFVIKEDDQMAYLAEMVTHIDDKPITWVRECSSCLRPFGTESRCEHCAGHWYHVVPMEPVDSLIPGNGE